MLWIHQTVEAVKTRKVWWLLKVILSNKFFLFLIQSGTDVPNRVRLSSLLKYNCPNFGTLFQSEKLETLNVCLPLIFLVLPEEERTVGGRTHWFDKWVNSICFWKFNEIAIAFPLKVDWTSKQCPLWRISGGTEQLRTHLPKLEKADKCDWSTLGPHTMGKLGQSKFFMFSHLTL